MSPDGCQLAWIEWDHPQQPWRCTRVMLAQLNEQGEVETARQVSDTDEAAWAQPRFSPDGTLHVVVDRNNWWRIESLTATGFQALSGTVPERTEFTTAPWQFGLATYGWNAAGALLALGQCDGYTYLWCHDGSAWCPLELSLMPARMHALVCDGNRLGCVAEFSDRLPAVVRIDSALTADDPDQCDILYGGDCPAYTPSLPVSLSVERDENLSVPYFLYRPAGIPADRLLPLVIWTHGGPTAMTAPSFKPAIQYWTQRGFMIADVNYRGSTGYGRDYRMQLEGQWGVRDVDDVIAVAADLVEQGQADPQALFIRGNNAGGYTTLSALCDSDLFSGGASLYGVSDPARLNQLTHKFESRYLHWLIGDPQQQSERYLERSPLHRADRISAPVIFFQGMQDQVVLPEQTRNMAERLNCNDIRVETHYFDNEAHGFRQPDNQAAVLEHELAFYRSIIS
ncbi:MAG: S9 family peptidase [Oceanospirillales bacterium]|nr:S9 family peptidase [Oceanospirillales bacterium]